MFLLFFFAVWGGGHAWLAWSLLPPLRHRRYLLHGGLLLLLVSLIGVPLAMFGMRAGIDPRLADLLAWFAFLDMGIFLLLVPLVLVRDLGLLPLRLWRRHYQQQPEDIERRHFFANTVNAGLLGLSGSMALAGYAEARQLARVKPVRIALLGLPDALQDFHIVQISDIHLGPTIKGDYLAGIVERCNELHPDLVAITGDLVDGFTAQLAGDVEPLASLRARHGSWFVTGNHEYYWGAADWCALLEQLNVGVLLNEHHVLKHNGAHLVLAGVTDYRAGKYLDGHASDPLLAKRSAPEDAFSILLAHQPRSAFAAAATGFDLQLSGHIHGGQFFPWNLAIGLVQPYGIGLHRVAGSMSLYVSAGTGYWGPPNRLGVPAEITSIRLARA